jgi:putative toxin-antitoxin system antitoxin component (TIGR02293 family)
VTAKPAPKRPKQPRSREGAKRATATDATHPSAHVRAVREAMPLRLDPGASGHGPRHLTAVGIPWTTLLRRAQGAAVDRIAMVRSGVPAAHLPALVAALDLPTSSVLDAIQIARTSLARRIAQHAVLAPDESERVVGLLALIGQVARMLQDSGVNESQSATQAARWLGAWLAASNNALGGETPLSYLDTAEGRNLVSRLLGAMEAGTYW